MKYVDLSLFDFYAERNLDTCFMSSRSVLCDVNIADITQYSINEKPFNYLA